MLVSWVVVAKRKKVQMDCLRSEDLKEEKA
jgi:hypothetical protein